MIARKHRFHGRSAVSRVKGSTVHARRLSARVQINNQGDYRLAVVVSKKIDSRAVVRNRIRRRLFESIRAGGQLNGMPIDIVIYVKSPDVAALPTVELRAEVATLTEAILRRADTQHKPRHDIVESRRKKHVHDVDRPADL